MPEGVVRASWRGVRVLPWALAALLSCAARASGQSVSFPASDGGVIHAEVVGSGPRAVVLAHGGRYVKESWAPQARIIAAAGFRVLAFDFRGRGESTGPGQADPMGAPLHLDVLGAVNYLRASGARTVAVVGGSMGGSAAADAAVHTPGAIDRLVLLGSDAGREPGRLTVPTLFILARGDTNASGTPRLVKIQAQYDQVPGPREMLLLDGTEHAQAIFQGPEGDRALAAILRFLERAP